MDIIDDKTVTTHELVDKEIEKLIRRYEIREFRSGVSWGFQDLDAMTDGIQNSTFTVLGARPCMGKTTFVLNVARHVSVIEKKAVAFFTFETSASQVTQRMLAAGAKLSSNQLRSGHIAETGWAKLHAEAKCLKEAALVIDDSCMTFQALADKCRRLKDRPERLFLVVLDDLQQLLMREFATARNENQPELTKRLKALAQELEIAIVATSQLTRAPEYRKNKRPILSDFGRGAGAPDNADIILFLYRDEYYYSEAPQRGVADLIIYRQKDGPTGTVELAYKVETGNFSDYMVHFADLYVASGEGCEVTSKGCDDVDKGDKEEFATEEG